MNGSPLEAKQVLARVGNAWGARCPYVNSVPQIHHLKAQLELRKEEALAEADQFRDHSLRQAEEVGKKKTAMTLSVYIPFETASRSTLR